MQQTDFFCILLLQYLFSMNSLIRPLFLLVVVSHICFGLQAQEALRYQQPDPALLALADAPKPPTFLLSPTRKSAAHLWQNTYLAIDQLAQPELRLAGLRFNPHTNGPGRLSAILRVQLQDMITHTLQEVSGLPTGARLYYPTWSPDGQYLAVVNEVNTGSNTGLELWVIAVASASARKLTEPVLNAIFGQPIQWMPDSKQLLVRRIAPNRAVPPADATVPVGPNVQQNLGKASPAPTYQDLLRTPADEAKFEYYATAQLARVGLDGNQIALASMGLITAALPSPDGQYVLVQEIKRPFSYLVNFSRFTRSITIVNATGQLVAPVADVAVNESQSIARDAVAPGARAFQWRADHAAMLIWAEAPDGGDPAKASEHRDVLYSWAAPFAGKPQTMLQLKLRFNNIQWGNDNLALVSEYWASTKRLVTHQFAPSNAANATVLFDRSYEDRYSDPGNAVSMPNAAGRPVLQVVDKGQALLFMGAGASPEGDRPFLRKLELKTKKMAELFRSQAPYYEQPIAMLNAEGSLLLTLRQSKSEVPNYYQHNLSNKKGPTRITDLPDPAPGLRGVSREVISYKRADGVQLSGVLYLPAGYKPGVDKPLPCLLWAYPIDFKSAQAASQMDGSPYTYTTLNWASPLFFVARGYAVLDDPKMPIVGEGKTEPNDTFVEQLVASARAAVDELKRRGVADTNRLAVGGHSYGAFMTAHLLSHTKLFAAGIARSGAYNRTLTPFGFQSEDRSYWQAPEVYHKMSPFSYAHNMKTPMLMTHGEADNNQGTYPIQSDRYYAALKGHGATVRLVTLPHEAHGYAARESILHMLWEVDQWLTTYVKNKQTP